MGAARSPHRGPTQGGSGPSRGAAQGGRLWPAWVRCLRMPPLARLLLTARRCGFELLFPGTLGSAAHNRTLPTHVVVALANYIRDGLTCGAHSCGLMRLKIAWQHDSN